VKFSEHEKEYNRTKRVENARFKNLSDEEKKTETERLKCEKEENKRLMLEKKKDVRSSY
jgi:hypothetical protein